MKKKFLGGIAILVVAIVAAVNVNLNSQKSSLLDIALANVEALADGEVLPGKECRYTGSSKYGDYIPCTATYPNIGQCGTRVTQ